MSEDHEEYVSNGIVTEQEPPPAELSIAPSVTRLCALDRVFDATGTVQVRCGQKTLTLPIQAIDFEGLEALVKSRRPKTPSLRQMENGRVRIIANENDATYLEKTADFNRLYNFACACWALTVDICAASGSVVWSADNSVHDLDAAHSALKAMGIVDMQVISIAQAAMRLTQAIDEEQVSD